MSIISKFAGTVVAMTAVAGLSAAQAAPVSFTQLTGVTGDPGAANTAVFKADLSTAGLTSISSLLISDSGVIGGSAPGQFSGFDLDAVIISTVNCATAACVAGLASDVILNYAGSIFTPGAQSAPADPKLYGTNVAGAGIDNAIATLGIFDGFSSVDTPNGFVSLGVNGSLGFNLAGPLSVMTAIYLYIGEVGNNGELAAGGIELFQDPLPDVPIPAALPLFLMGLGALRWQAKRRTA